MKQFFLLKGILSGFPTKHSFCMFESEPTCNLNPLFSWAESNHWIALVGFYVVICMMLIVLLALFWLLTQNKRQKQHIIVYRHRSAEYLRLIRTLLDLCYTYGESPQVFLEKFKDKVNIRELKSYNLIEYQNRHLEGLKEDEKILCLLWKQGFTHRELCVIFNLKKVSNLYIKYNRIQKKMKRV